MSVCPHCPCLVPFGYPIDLEPLWLHALAYSGPGWAFTAPPPELGEEGFKVLQPIARGSVPHQSTEQGNCKRPEKMPHLMPGRLRTLSLWPSGSKNWSK
jgi:hypothetical protein